MYRFRGALTALAVLAVVSAVVITSGPWDRDSEYERQIGLLMKGDPDDGHGKQSARTVVGDRGENTEPWTFAEEQYALRAYPEAEIPFSLTLGAQAAFNQVKSRAPARGRNAVGQWALVGPSSANYPDVL